MMEQYRTIRKRTNLSSNRQHLLCLRRAPFTRFDIPGYSGVLRASALVHGVHMSTTLCEIGSAQTARQSVLEHDLQAGEASVTHELS